MQVVTDLDAALANVAVLEEVRLGKQPSHHAAYLSLIKRGTCFLPYPRSGGLAFAPSRFIGYAGNSFNKHALNKARDGRQTNAALNTILGHLPVPEEKLEQEYRRFCGALGIEPWRMGTFGVSRKFWITPNIKDRLDVIAQEEIMANPNLTQTQKEQLVKSRIGQGAFRDGLLAKWKRCCMTGCEIRPILRASHIKPWRHSNNEERLDVFNGLLLSPTWMPYSMEA